MNRILQNYMDFMDAENLSYYPATDHSNMICIRNSLNSHPNVSYSIVIDLGEDESRACAIIVKDLLKVQHITYTLLEKINKLNNKYRWYKIAVLNNGEIWLSLDSLLDGETNKILMSYIIRLMDILDDVYHELIRVI